EHWLADEPVSALPESRFQRLARWSRHHRNWTYAGVASLVVLTLASLVVTLVVDKARQDEQAARLKAEQARLQEEEQRERRERLAAELALAHGLVYAFLGSVDDGLLWMGTSLGIVPSEANDLERAIRINLGSWRHRTAMWLVPLQHSNKVLSVAFSPDTRQVLTGCADRTARLWDAETGTPLLPPLEHSAAVQRVAFSPDAKVLLTE